MIANTINKPGYKLTPLGWIPVDWEIYEFTKIASKSSIKFDPQKDRTIKKCIELEHLSQNTGELLGYVSSAEQKSIKNVFSTGNILFGKLRPYLKKYWFSTFDGVCSSEIWVLINNKNISHNTFLFYLIQGSCFIQASNVTSGSKMPRSDWDYIAETPFLIPPLPEQKAIAALLSLWDKAIEKTEELIKQKELLKKALMQQLLTGKKRLKGFSGEWKKVKLGNLGNTYTGLTGKFKEDFGSGKPYIPYLNIFNNTIINIEQVDYVKINSCETQNKVKYGDIFFTVSSETQNEVGMASVFLDHHAELYLNSFCFGFRLKDFNTLVPQFSSYFFRADKFRKEINKLSQGATRFNLSKNNLMKLNILLPKVEEQTAIAKILETADKEIKIIKTKLEALKEQKKGLMQVLLTGKVRIK